MQWMKTLKSGIQNGICPLLAKKKKKPQKPEIPENLKYSAERTYDNLWKQQVEGTTSMKSISPRKLKCLSNEYCYGESIIKNIQDHIEAQQNGNLCDQMMSFTSYLTMQLRNVCTHAMGKGN